MLGALAKFVRLLQPRRRWAQFSLGTLFLVVTVVCVWLGVVVNRASRQRDAVAAIEAAEGKVEYAEPDDPAGKSIWRKLLRRWLPRDYMNDVRLVDFRASGATDVELGHLEALTGLERLYLLDTQVTDAGLAHLGGLSGLEWLYLGGTQVTDTGLSHLKRLTRLKVLRLDRTQVTDGGLAQLRAATKLERLYLSRDRITDAGLAHLHGLTRLKVLRLRGTGVSYAGVSQLREALPNCRIFGP